MVGKILIILIKLYQKTISPNHGVGSLLGKFSRCRFYPTCSQYACQAIEGLGVIKGLGWSIARVVRCNALFGGGGYDPFVKK